MSNWTPGPWEIEQGRAPHVKEIKGPNREAICATHNWLDSDPIQESRANAQLIAAAPELDESLGDMMALVLTAYGNIHEDVNELYVKAKRAKAKARGEEQ